MPKDDPIEATILQVADVIGGLMDFWGFKRAMGRIWALLYLTPRPVSAQEMQERLHMSAGAVSMTLSELQQWGVVKKTWLPGERRDYYEPETSIWKMVSRVFQQRELLRIQEAITTFQRALDDLGKAAKRSAQARGLAGFVSERVESLLALARVGEAVLSTILERDRVDLSEIKKIADN